MNNDNNTIITIALLLSLLILPRTQWSELHWVGKFLLVGIIFLLTFICLVHLVQMIDSAYRFIKDLRKKK